MGLKTTLTTLLGGAAVALAIPALAGGEATTPSSSGPVAVAQASPENLAKVIAGHVQKKDLAALDQLFLPIELLEKVARCEDDDDDLRDDIRESRRELGKLVAKHGGSEFVRLKVDEQREVAVGTRLEDCVAREALGWFEGDIYTSRGDDFDVDMIRVGAKWYVVDFDD